MKYFLDTYALIAIANGDPRFQQYLESDATTLNVNLLELYYFFLRKYNEKTAAHFLQKFIVIAGDFQAASVGEAMKLKYAHKNKRMSYIDCIGYIHAKREKRIFVTGDRAFTGFEGVDCVR